MKKDKGPFSSTGSAGVLWYIATADSPLTIAELAEGLSISRGYSKQTVLRLWCSGFLVRRKRSNGLPGANPHEYAITDRIDDEGDDG